LILPKAFEEVILPARGKLDGIEIQYFGLDILVDDKILYLIED